MTAIFGAVLICTSFGYVGFAYGAFKKGQWQVAEGFLALFEYMLLRLPSLCSMEEIWGDFSHPALDKRGIGALLRDKGLGCNKRLMAAIDMVKDDTVLYELLNRAAYELGNTDYERQEKQLAQTVKELSALCAARANTYKTEEKSYRWVGVLCGGALSILLL